ncbi:MAG: ABC transporter substrate-binding protein [Actinobacteria bacterium]|nr:ABC transporter substrate-binding protein [Actinomycetota bacterium]
MRRVGHVVLGIALLTLAGCGARWSASERAAVIANHFGPRNGAVRAGSSTAASTDAATDTVGAGAADNAGPTAAGGPVAATKADAVKTATGQQAARGAQPCAAHSDAPGVTDSTVTVGTISTLSGPVPGLGESSQGAARAYVAYMNSKGGVCGRKVDLKTGDDGYDAGRYRALVTEFNPKILGIVGGLAAGDGGGAALVTQYGMPVVSLPTADSMSAAPVVFDTNPPYKDTHQPTKKTQYLFDHGVRTVAYVYADIDQAKQQIAEQRAQVEATGIKVVLDLALPLSTLNYDSAARQVANSKADYMFFLHSAGADASMATSMRGTGYKLKFEEYLTAYGSNFIQLGGDAVNGTTSWIRTLPIEDGGVVPEQKAFAEWMDRAAPGASPDTFASDSWVGAKAFFDNLMALKGPITRAALVAQLKSVDTYDAGGFLGPIQLGRKLNNGCLIGMIVDKGVWKRLTPASGFLC